MALEDFAFNRAAQLLPFVKAFEARGGETASVLHAAGLAHLDLSDPTALITGNALFSAVHKMAEALDAPYFTARVAERFVKDGPVFVRESAKTSKTLAEFLPLAMLELNRQVSNVRYSLMISAESTVIRGERMFTPNVPVVQADAAAACIWVTLLRLVVSKDFDSSLVFVTAKEGAGIPADLIPKSSFIKRKWNGVQIAFPSDWLRRPFDVDWKFPAAPRGEFEDASQRKAIRAFLEEAYLETMNGDLPSKEQLARHLGVHPKRLQRVLARMGTNLYEIKDCARRKKVLNLLAANKTISLQEIAEAVGFSSQASFSRAFKRWTGQTPNDYRREK